MESTTITITVPPAHRLYIHAFISGYADGLRLKAQKGTLISALYADRDEQSAYNDGKRTAQGA